MRSASADFRCKSCQALLAKRDPDGITIRRGELQTAVTGSDFTVSICCYRCKTLNVASSPSRSSRLGVSSASAA